MIRGQFVSLLACCALSVAMIVGAAVPQPVPILMIALAVAFLVAVVFFLRWTVISTKRHRWALAVSDYLPGPDTGRQGSATAV